MNPEYSVQIIWSKEDGAYLAAPFELPGCIADGATQEEALANLRIIIQEWIEVAREEGRQIPEPMSVEDHERFSQKVQEEVHNQLGRQIQNAFTQLLEEVAAHQEPVLHTSPLQHQRFHRFPIGELSSR